MPLEIDDLKTKIKKAKKTIAKLGKGVPGSQIVHHLKKRRLAGLECRLKQREADRKAGIGGDEFAAAPLDRKGVGAVADRNAGELARPAAQRRYHGVATVIRGHRGRGGVKHRRGCGD